MRDAARGIAGPLGLENEFKQLDREDDSHDILGTYRAILESKTTNPTRVHAWQCRLRDRLRRAETVKFNIPSRPEPARLPIGFRWTGVPMRKQFAGDIAVAIVIASTLLTHFSVGLATPPLPPQPPNADIEALKRSPGWIADGAFQRGDCKSLAAQIEKLTASGERDANGEF